MRKVNRGNTFLGVPSLRTVLSSYLGYTWNCGGGGVNKPPDIRWSRMTSPEKLRQFFEGRPRDDNALGQTRMVAGKRGYGEIALSAEGDRYVECWRSKPRLRANHPCDQLEKHVELATLRSTRHPMQ